MGANFNSYEDLPVETSGREVSSLVSMFTAIDLGQALDNDIRRYKHMRPPVQRYAIPIILDRFVGFLLHAFDGALF